MENIILNEEKSLLLQVQSSLSDAINNLKISLRTDNSSFRTNLSQNEFTLRTIASYQEMLSSPYYARYDFIYDGDDTITKIYVTQNNVTFDLPQINTIIIPWHIPLAQALQYATVGYISLESEHIEGKLLLKRILKIKDGQILSCSTLGESSTLKNESLIQEVHDDIKYVDSYIIELLNEHSSNKLKTILSSVQSEQNKIITAPKESSVIINGCAGSGKSSILLLRLAYLIHRYDISQDDILVLTPSKLFKNYISKSFSDIDLHGINAMTWNEFLFSIIPSKNVPPEFTNLSVDITNFKTSVDFLRLLDVYIEHLNTTIVKTASINLLNTTLIDSKTIEDLFYCQLSTLPLNQKIEKFKELFMAHCNKNFETLLTELYKTYLSEQKLHQTFITDSSALEKISNKIENEYNNIKERLKISYKLLTSEYLAQLNTLNIKDAYINLITNRSLLEKLAKQINITLTPNILDTIAHMSCLDLIPFIYLYIKIEKLPIHKIRYLLIDEAQDVSPLLAKILSLLLPYSTFTYMGDENQSSLPDFRINTLCNYTSSKLNIINLNVAYRNSYEITLLAREVLKKKSNIKTLPTPIDRSSVAPTILKTNAVEQTYEVINKLLEHHQALYTTIAIICKNEQTATSLYSALSSYMDIQLLSNTSEQYSNGIIITTVAFTKGLEFDAVILPDVDSINYPSTSSNDLYVAITRALHSIDLLYTGEISPLLDGIPTTILKDNVMECLSTSTAITTKLSTLGQYVYSQIKTIYGKATADSYKGLLKKLSDEDLESIAYDISSDINISSIFNHYLI